MREQTKAAAQDILKEVCAANRSREHQQLVVVIANRRRISRHVVRRLIGQMADKGWVELHRGRRLNSKLWVRPTPMGRKAWDVVFERLRRAR